jgi:hypothetical protein
MEFQHGKLSVKNWAASWSLVGSIRSVCLKKPV